MSLASGARLGMYEVLAPLGAGGMGEVYRARDTKLGRSVAVKVLPDAVAHDADRISRFEREAKSLAALNHPHIATLFGMEEAEGRHFLVMELVEGETLAERVARGSLPLDETLRIARQIAEALETAHECGIVHRDLKPANVKITPDDQVKVLDFGLAKALETSPSTPNFTHSPTLSVMATGAGMILGTAAYMSPEQAKGHPADHRSDVFSFGCVLYEMLTGRQAFRGETIADILASVLARDPDWSALPANLNPRLLALLQRCLDKHRKQRWQAIGDVRAELEAIAAAPLAVTVDAPSVAAPRPLWKRALPIASAAVLASGLTAAVFLTRSTPAPPVARFSIGLGEQGLSGTVRRVLDIAPDGSAIVYVSNARFYVRSLNALEGHPIPMSDVFGSPEAPAFSPDGQWIAFWARSDRTLKRMAVSGGSALTLSAPFAANQAPLVLTWNGSHLYLGVLTIGIVRVPENGGELETIVKVSSPGEYLYAPRVLPSGDAIIFTSAPVTTGGVIDFAAAKVEAYSLKTKERTAIVPLGADATYLSTGHLVYASGGVMYAVPFDAERLIMKGGPLPIVEGVQRSTAGGALMHAAVSRTGVLAYVPGPATASLSTGTWQVALFDQNGIVRSLKIPPANYGQPRVSPDGKLLAFVRTDGPSMTLWMHDLSDATAPRRLTFEGISQFPVWLPDSQRILFQSNLDGKPPSVFVVRADGSSVPERLTEAESATAHVPYSVSPDGQHLLFDIAKADKWSLWTLSLRDKKSTHFGAVQSTLLTDAQFSPDGRWVSYTTRQTPTRSVVFVQPFPPTGAKYQVSPDSEDGHHATWDRSGSELFYNPGPGGPMNVVRITTKPTFGFAAATSFNRTFQSLSPLSPRPYDVMRGGDGRPVFVGQISPGASDGRGVTAQRIDVVLNWHEELKARAPVK